MKKSILFTIIALFIVFGQVSAFQPNGFYPANQQGPAMPVPFFQQNQQNQQNQQPQNNRPNLYPVQPYNPQTYYPQPYNPQPQNNRPNLYPVQPYNPQPYYPQPAPTTAPSTSFATCSTEWNNNGTLKLAFTVKNVSAYTWGYKVADILCVNGTQFLLNDTKRWDIPYTVKNGETLSFSVNIFNGNPGESMTFAMMDGGKELYRFTIYPFTNSYNPQPYYPKPYYPQAPTATPAPDIQVYRQWNHDGSMDLTWIVRNVTGKSWDKSNIDIKLDSGVEWMANPNTTRWDIPYTVANGSQLRFTVKLYRPAANASMQFSLMDGGNRVYTFTVKP